MERAITSSEKTEHYLSRFKEKHGDKYSYPDLHINSAKDRLTIICPQHGEFDQTVESHLRYGCRKCGVISSRINRTMTQSEFEERVRKAHGDTYGLEKAIFKNATTKVTMVCKLHGDFEATPSDLFRGVGCWKCGGSKKYTQEEYLEEVRKVHGDRYILDDVVYTGTVNTVKVTCREHGPFTINARIFKDGSNCKKCANKITAQKTTYDTEKFKKLYVEKHGNYYNLDKAVYKGSMNKITVTCPKHGDFETIPSRLLQGNGCYRCGVELRTSKLIKPKEVLFNNFLKKAKKRHGDKYEYFSEYGIDIKGKCKIKCKACDSIFYQNSVSHYRGIGCRSCGFKRSALASSYNQEDFLAKAKEVHGDTYDYSEVVYEKSWIKVKIRCKKHGFFMQTPVSHLRGSGCKFCNESRGERAINLILLRSDIPFKREFTFPESIRKFRYDFYLPTLRILIEFHGEQHYRPVDHFGGQQGHETLVKRDKIKEKYAKSVRHTLVVFNYKHLSLSYKEFKELLFNTLRSVSSTVPRIWLYEVPDPDIKLSIESS